MSGKLDRATVYLSGSMEASKDNGVAWRREFIRQIESRGLDINCIDPTNKPGPTGLLGMEDRQYQIELQESGRFEELREYVHNYRRLDLRYVDISDAIVVCIDPELPHWGTPDEIYTAEDQHKPILCIVEGGLKRLPRWLFDVIEFDDIFETVEDCVERLCQLDSGEKEMDGRWVLSYLYDHRKEESELFSAKIRRYLEDVVSQYCLEAAPIFDRIGCPDQLAELKALLIGELSGGIPSLAVEHDAVERPVHEVRLVVDDREEDIPI